MAKETGISDLSFADLLEVISWGICKKVPKEEGTMKNAFCGGKYLGAPGKDVYFALHKLDDDKLVELASKLSKIFSKDAPSNHVGPAACIRYIYGQFEKQGIMRSNTDFERMQKEDLDSQWQKPRHFISLLNKCFLEDDNFYGLCITHEMEGHRLGDESVINKDTDKLLEMEETYLLSVHYAYKCKSYKQMFTPFYWAAKYFMSYNNKAKALEFSKKCIEQAEKHCPDSRGSYVEKLLDCIKYVKKRDPKIWPEWYKKYKNNAKNKCVQKAFSKKLK